MSARLAVLRAANGWASARLAGLTPGKGKGVETISLAAPVTLPERRKTGISELDRVLGGGLVEGSATLIGGDPGIGKSTLLLQAAAALAQMGAATTYITGEESTAQVQLRAERLGAKSAPVALAAATSVRDILATIDKSDAPEIVIIDSIQTMFIDALDSAPARWRRCAPARRNSSARPKSAALR